MFQTFTDEKEGKNPKFYYDSRSEIVVDRGGSRKVDIL